MHPSRIIELNLYSVIFILGSVRNERHVIYVDKYVCNIESIKMLQPVIQKQSVFRDLWHSIEPIGFLSF